MSRAAGHVVRPATEGDLGSVCAIVNHFIETTVFNFRTEAQTVDEWGQDWRRLHGQFPWLVATDGDRVAGVAYAAPWKERAAYRWTVETTVYLSLGDRGRGVGDALYTELLGRLRRQGFCSALAVIALPNEPSVRLHERHGFVRAARLVDAGFKMGGWHDVGIWQCLLRHRSEEPAEPLGVEGA